jgi:hypothetical protein
MSFIGKIQNDYEQLWRYIIRPARCPYPEKALGPAIITVEGREVHRKDFMLTNPRGLDFCCSLWVPADVKSCPCVVYLHGNSSNRTEGYPQTHSDWNICVDFSGITSPFALLISRDVEMQKESIFLWDFTNKRI